MEVYKEGEWVTINFEGIDTWTAKQLIAAGFNKGENLKIKGTDAHGNVLIHSYKFNLDMWVANEHVRRRGATPKPAQEPQTAVQIMEEGLKSMKERAALRDSEDGERSMKGAVDAFNALTGAGLTEEEGWLFMAILKASRSRKGTFHVDDFVDGAAYFALAGEAAAKGEPKY